MITNKYPTYEVVDSTTDCFIPSTPLETSCLQDSRVANPASYDGMTIEEMARNPIHSHGFDDIDKACLCRDALVNSRQEQLNAADRVSRVYKAVLAHQDDKKPVTITQQYNALFMD